VIDAAAASHTGIDVYMDMSLARFSDFYQAIHNLYSRRK
jgi:hypothetical protein